MKDNKKILVYFYTLKFQLAFVIQLRKWKKKLSINKLPKKPNIIKTSINVGIKKCTITICLINSSRKILMKTERDKRYWRWCVSEAPILSINGRKYCNQPSHPWNRFPVARTAKSGEGRVSAGWGAGAQCRGRWHESSALCLCIPLDFFPTRLPWTAIHEWTVCC